jgi:hypothetical protein
MARFREKRKPHSVLAVLCLGLALWLGLNQGCARSEPLHRSDSGSQAAQQRLPFHSETDQASANDGAYVPGAADPKQAASLPFRATAGTHVLPAGTLLTVQLDDALSTAKAHAGDEFSASVAAPLTIDRETLIQPGTTVTGRVESARSLAAHPGRAPGSGYFRLTLSSISVEHRQIAIQTSSLFARGTLQPSGGVGVRKDRALTFRLTAPVMLDQPNSMANGQSPSPATTE